MYKTIAALVTAGIAAVGGLIYGGVQKKNNSNLKKMNDELQQKKNEMEDVLKQKKMKEKEIDDFNVDNIEDADFMEDI